MSLNWDLAPGVGAGTDPNLSTPQRKSQQAEAGGGSLSGGAQLFLLRSENCVQDGGSTCGYLRGKDKRTICLAQNCEMTSHKTAGSDKRFEFEEGISGVLVILTSPEVALAKPTAEPGLFGIGLDRYLKERRSVDAWVTLLEQTRKHSLSGEEVDQVADTLDEQAVQRRLYTPWKKRRVDLAVGPSPSESASSFLDITFVAPMEDLGSTDEPDLILSNLKLEWPSLVQNLTTLHEMVASAKRGNKEVADTLDEEVQTISGQLLLLLSKLGDRPSEFNGASAFDSLSFIKDEQKQMSAELLALDGRTQKLDLHNTKQTANLELLRDLVKAIPTRGTGGVTEAEMLAMRDGLVLQVRGAIEPFIALVSKTSSTRTDPGGLLIKRLTDLERSVVHLRATKVDVGTSGPPTAPSYVSHAAHSATPSLSWALPVAPSTATPAALGAATGLNHSVLEQKVLGLERRVVDLEAQLGGEAVNVGGTDFGSLSDVGAWMKVHAPADGDFAFFLDCHGLMALAHNKGATTQEVLKMNEYKEKLKYTSIDAALIATGFQIAIPEFFGIRTSDRSAKALPGLSKGQDWDARDGDRGLRYDITRRCSTVYLDRTTNMKYSLSPVARLVAGSMLTETHEFTTGLVTWISTFLTDRANKGDNEAETIQHMSHAVRTIMEMLHAVRAPGRGPFAPGEMGAKILWGTLQAVVVMRELRRVNFSGSPALSHILNLHLQDNAVTKSELAAMEKRLKATMDELKVLKSAVDRGGWAKPKKKVGGGEGGVE
jgi:hypothetical protein